MTTAKCYGYEISEIIVDDQNKITYLSRDGKLKQVPIGENLCSNCLEFGKYCLCDHPNMGANFKIRYDRIISKEQLRFSEMV